MTQIVMTVLAWKMLRSNDLIRKLVHAAIVNLLRQDVLKGGVSSGKNLRLHVEVGPKDQKTI